MAHPKTESLPAVANVPAKPGKPPGLGAWPGPAPAATPKSATGLFPDVRQHPPVEGQVSEFSDLSHHLSAEARTQGFSMRHVPTDESSGSVHFHGPKGQWLGRVAYTGKGTDKPDWQYHVGDQVMKQPHVHTPVVNHLARALGDVFRPRGQFQGLLDEAAGNSFDFDRHLAGAVNSLGKAEGSPLWARLRKAGTR